MPNIENKLLIIANELFPDVDIIIRSVKIDSFEVAFKYHDTSFDDMQKISSTFDTKNINLEDEEHTEGYCETCSYSYTFNVVYVKDVSIDRIDQIYNLLTIHGHL